MSDPDVALDLLRQSVAQAQEDWSGTSRPSNEQSFAGEVGLAVADMSFEQNVSGEF